jgi:hypothetical protein
LTRTNSDAGRQRLPAAPRDEEYLTGGYPKPSGITVDRIT